MYIFRTIEEKSIWESTREIGLDARYRERIHPPGMAQEKSLALAVRFCAALPSIYEEQRVTAKGDVSFRLLSLPHYLVQQTARLIACLAPHPHGANCQPYPHYEPDPDAPGLLVRIDEV